MEFKISKDDSSRPCRIRLSPWLFTIALVISTGLLLNQVLPRISSIPSISTTRDLRNYFFNPTKAIALNSPTCLETVRPLLLPNSDHLPFFDSVRVISLKSRSDRRQHMNKLDRYLNLNIKFHDAIYLNDPKVIEIVNRVGTNTKADNKRAEVGHVACRMSHQLAIQAAERDGDQTSLFLEDDVDIEVAFKYLAGTILRDVPNDWDIIFFGHTDFSDESRRGRDPTSQNFFVYNSVEPQGGHGYALSRKGRKLILDLLDNKRPNLYATDQGQPIDEIFMYLARSDLAKLYSIIPDLVVQRSLFKSDILGTPAGYNDGMHNKPLLDSTLERIKSQENIKAHSRIDQFRDGHY